MGRSEKRERSQKNKFTMKMQKKLVVLFILVLLAFAGISVRLFLINRDNGERYKKQVLSQQQYSSRTIPFKRGDILDSKGTKLAVSEKVYNVVLDCKLMREAGKQIKEEEKCVNMTVAALARCFDTTESEIRTYVEANPSSQYYVVAKRQTYDQIAPFQEMDNDEETGKYISGVWFEEEYKRAYPGGTLACDVIGFTSKDNVGNFGLEEYYNDVLSGVNGREYGYLNDDSNLERTTKAAVDGYNIVTTLDANIQGIVERKLKEFNETYQNAVRTGNGARNVGCVIQDVNNGNILAMAGYPNFDLNDPKNVENLIGTNLVDEKGNVLSDVVTPELAEELAANADSNDTLRLLNSLWRNFCIFNTYEPGSTMKPFTVAAGLESGALTGNEVYQCNGSLVISEGEKPIKCHNVYGDGPVTVKDAVEMSCNVALMRMGQAMGEDTFLKYFEDFNFGLKTNVDLAGESRTASLVYNENSMGPTELATSTFGQGFNVTMIEMITGFSALVNGGYYYEPHMVSKITASDGSVVKNIEPRVLKQVISEETSAKIRDYCLEVVIGEDGTGHTARPAGYLIGGKTGTAETQPRGNKEYVVSFIGFAPADDPQIAIYVVVDRPNTEKQDDAKFATRIVKSVLTEVLPYLDIFMTEPLSDKEREELEAQQIAYREALASSVSGNEIPEEENGTETPDGETGGETEQEPQEEYIKPEITIDPDTGLGMLPDGTKVDPNTGEPVDNVELNLPEPITSGDSPEDDGSPF